MGDRLLLVALTCMLALVVGCGSLAFTDAGHLALDLGSPGSSPQMPDREPAVLERFDALEDRSGGADDSNKRAGANCAGGVCAIF